MNIRKESDGKRQEDKSTSAVRQTGKGCQQQLISRIRLNYHIFKTTTKNTSFYCMKQGGMALQTLR